MRVLQKGGRGKERVRERERDCEGEQKEERELEGEGKGEEGEREREGKGEEKETRLHFFFNNCMLQCVTVSNSTTHFSLLLSSQHLQTVWLPAEQSG